LILATLARLEEGTASEREQRHGEATYAPRLTRDDGRVDWSLSAPELVHRLRAFTPWPGLAATLRGHPVKLLAAVAVDWEVVPPGAAGSYLGLRQGRLAVVCGGGTLLGIERLQRAGRRPLAAGEFARGERLAVGERFG
jgi:methionyl-tRNA formyltransferase